jgi:hypothetical protein
LDPSYANEPHPGDSGDLSPHSEALRHQCSPDHEFSFSTSRSTLLLRYGAAALRALDRLFGRD